MHDDGLKLVVEGGFAMLPGNAPDDVFQWVHGLLRFNDGDLMFGAVVVQLGPFGEGPHDLSGLGIHQRDRIHLFPSPSCVTPGASLAVFFGRHEISLNFVRILPIVDFPSSSSKITSSSGSTPSTS